MKRMLSDLEPAVAGENVTVTVHEELTPSDDPQVLVNEKPCEPVCSVIEVMERLEAPVFVSVVVCVELEVPVV